MSADRFDYEDPRWSAYVLDELSPEDKKSVEDLLRQSDEARQWVDDLRDTADLLSGEFENEPQPKLSKSQRARVESRLHDKPARRRAWLPCRRS